MDEQKTDTQVVEATEVVKKAAAPAFPSSFLIIAVVLAVVVIAGLYYYSQSQSDTANVLTTNEPAGVEAVAQEYPAVVAIVNGQEVSGSDFAISVQQVTQVAAQQGVDPSDSAVQEQIQTQAIDVLINTVLLGEAAKAGEVTVTDEAVEAEIAQIQGQYESPEAFAQAVTDSGLSMDKVRSDVYERQLVNNYLESNSDVAAVTVSEAEVTAAYDSFATGATELPPLEQVYAPLEQQLITQKKQEIIAGIIDGLRQAATIEIKL